ncbi:MAG TPA: response regulator [Pyrinomonadaceae bacterium]|nr:response regulator [Pyrinomonadaceae bacterium]
MSILIAEDNVAQRHYLREILEKEFPSHAPIVEAADGEETVKLALEHQPAVSILDIQLPKIETAGWCSSASYPPRALFSGRSFHTKSTSTRFVRL